jgi:hypothetical protein
VVSELIELKRKDKNKNQIEWGIIVAIPEESSKVLYVGWKNNTFVLVISIFYISDRRIIRIRKQFKEIFSNTKTTRKPFRDQPITELEIPVIYNSYNHYIGDIDTLD